MNEITPAEQVAVDLIAALNDEDAAGLEWYLGRASD